MHDFAWSAIQEEKKIKKISPRMLVFVQSCE